jgi:menaquinone C8-methyltransferase
MSLIQIESPRPAGSREGLAQRFSELWELPIDYQRLRHTDTARWLRGTMYRLFVGREGWPIVFRPPAGEGPQGVSAHLYVHLPFCRQICPHCPYNKMLYRAALHDRYGHALYAEIAPYFRERPAPPVQTLYFGGGTPSVTPELIRQSVEQMSPFLAADAEIGVEVHPGDATLHLLGELHAMGVNRVSLGVETFRPDLLKRLGRTYTPAQAEQAIRDARAAGFRCVDVNLICAIPGQSDQDTAADAARCLALGVDQISAYTLFTFGHTTLGRQIRQRRLPVYGDRARLKAQQAIAGVCRDAGYQRTSPWNFTRPGMTPYSTVTREDYVGFGAGAGSKVEGVFWFNTFSVDAYVEQERNCPALVLEAGERFRRFHWLYWQLYRTQVMPQRYREQFGRDLERDFGVLLAMLRAARMARKEGGAWRVTEFGAVWMHRLQQLFSITYIDDLWEHCRGEAWPREVVLS